MMRWYGGVVSKGATAELTVSEEHLHHIQQKTEAHDQVSSSERREEQLGNARSEHGVWLSVSRILQRTRNGLGKNWR